MAVATKRQAPATTETTETRTEKGVSLARGPALILGSILLAVGLYSLYKQHTFPPFSNFPDGKAPVGGKVLGIFGANGWTGMLTAVAGGLLLFGAAQHLLAKTMSLIVGAALGAAAVIALISGDVLGMAAANHMTELAWGIAAAILLFNTLVPRRRRKVEVAEDSAANGAGTTGYAASRRRSTVADREAVPAGDYEPVGDREAVPARNREPVGDHGAVAADERVGDYREPVGDRGAVAADERMGDNREPVGDRGAVAADERVGDNPPETQVATQRRRPAGEEGPPPA